MMNKLSKKLISKKQKLKSKKQSVKKCKTR